MSTKCDDLGIPGYLQRQNRPEKQNFRPREKLYRRIPPDGFISEHEISAMYLRVSEMSLNRERYSKFPEDVLIDSKTGKRYSSYGIIEFQVRLVESQTYPHPEQTHIKYRFEMVHKPEECMYPHSEIKIIINGPGLQKIPKSVSALFRDEIIKNCNKY